MEDRQIKSDLLGTFWREDNGLKKDFSFIRSGDANWLLCSMLTSVVEDIAPIIFAYRLKLEIMQDRFNSQGTTNEDYLLKVHSCQREIEWVQRKVSGRGVVGFTAGHSKLTRKRRSSPSRGSSGT